MIIRSRSVFHRTAIENAFAPNGGVKEGPAGIDVFGAKVTLNNISSVGAELMPATGNSSGNTFDLR